MGIPPVSSSFWSGSECEQIVLLYASTIAQTPWEPSTVELLNFQKHESTDKSLLQRQHTSEILLQEFEAD